MTRLRRCHRCLDLREIRNGAHYCEPCRAIAASTRRARNGYTGRPRHWATKGPCVHCGGLSWRVPRGTICLCGTKHKAEPKVHATEFLEYRKDCG